MLNYKERCKDCCYLFEIYDDDFVPNGEWCCECYEKLCKQIYKCPQIDEIEIVEVKNWN